MSQLTRESLRAELESFAQTIRNNIVQDVMDQWENSKAFVKITGPSSHLKAYQALSVRNPACEGADKNDPEEKVSLLQNGTDLDLQNGTGSPASKAGQHWGQVRTVIPAQAVSKKLNHLTSPTVNAKRGSIVCQPPPVDEPQPGLLSRVVTSSHFSMVTAVVVLLNILFIAIETDYSSTHVGEPSPEVYRMIEHLFCAYFVTEICLRITTYRKDFFCNTQYYVENYFDLMLATMQAVDAAKSLFVSEKSGTGVRSKLRLFRLFRVLRLLRVFRVVRLVMALSELRMLIISIGNSLKSLVWVLLLVFLCTFAFGICLTQITLEHRLEAAGSNDVEVNHELLYYYGSLSRTILVLYEAISDGTSCATLMDPLMESISPWMSVPFILYTAFVTFAMMNVITSSFVEASMRAAQDDSNDVMIHALMDMFNTYDDDGDIYNITKAEFEQCLERPEMQRYLGSMNVSPANALDSNFFALIDADGSGSVDSKELVDSCLRLRGPARAIDLAVFMHEYRLDTAELKKWTSDLVSRQNRL